MTRQAQGAITIYDVADGTVGGGRNLCTKSLWNTTSTAYGFASTTAIFNLEAGKTYTFSANGRATQLAVDEGHHLRAVLSAAGTALQIIQFTELVNTTKQLTFTVVTTGICYITSYLYASAGVRTGDVTLNWYKLEEGNIATTWSPSLEEAAVEAKTYVQSRGENLTTNGSGLLGNNTNFGSFVFDGAEAPPGAGGSFKHTALYGAKFNDEYLPVDTSQKYIQKITVKGTGAPKLYVGIGAFDADKLPINSSYHMHFPLTNTTLAVDLVDGATTMVLTSMHASWGTNGVTANARCVTFWDYKNSFGYTYPTGTYSRHISGFDTWLLNADVNVATKTITLRVPWVGGLVPAGTSLSQSSSGETYKYCTLVGQSLSTDWTTYEGSIGEVDYSGSNLTNMFPPGTSTVQWLFLLNYGDAGVVRTTYLANLSFAAIAQDTAKVGGVNAATVRDNASNALANAATANALLTDITSDSILTPSEKPDVVLAYNSLIAEQAGIDAQATAYGVTAEKTSYDAAVTALTTYLGGLASWNTIPGVNVAIVGTTFRTNFQTVYTARQALLNAIFAKAQIATALAGTRSNITENAQTFVARPVGGSLSVAGSPVGAIKIALPVFFTSTMVQFSVDVYNYLDNTSFTVLIGGYTLSDTTWLNTSASIIGGAAANYTVRFGHDGVKACVWIGELATTWSYPKVVVKNLQAGHSNYALSVWETGWAVSTVAAFDTVLVTDTDNMVYASDVQKVAGTLSATIRDNAVKANASVVSMESDNKFSIAEKRQWQISWPGEVATYNAVLASAAMAGVSTTTLVAARLALYDFLNTTHTVFAATPVETTLVQGDLTNKTAAYYTALSIAVDATAIANVSAVQIGGRNLVMNSKLVCDIQNIVGSGTSVLNNSDPNNPFWTITATDAGGIATYNAIYNLPNMVVGRKYTLSCEVRTAVASSISFFNAVGGAVTTSANVWTKMEYTFVYTATTLRVAGHKSTLMTLDYRNYKMEEGTKATDWSAAPEDVMAYTDQVAICYGKFTGSGATPSGNATMASGTFPAATSFGVTWLSAFSATMPTLASGEFLYMSRGHINLSSGMVTWSTPYVSGLKVDSLSALTANLGSVTLGTDGKLSNAPYGFAGIFLGRDGGSNKFSVVGDGVTPKFLKFDGTTLTFNGTLGLNGAFSTSGSFIATGTTSTTLSGSAYDACILGVSTVDTTCGIIGVSTHYSTGVLGISYLGGWGVYGEAYDNAVGVFGDAIQGNSVGVRAKNIVSGGKALDVIGLSVFAPYGSETSTDYLLKAYDELGNITFSLLNNGTATFAGPVNGITKEMVGLPSDALKPYVILAWGQSNEVGFYAANGGDYTMDPNIFLWDTNALNNPIVFGTQFLPAQLGVAPLNKMNGEEYAQCLFYQVAREIRRRTGRPVYVIPLAAGAHSIEAYLPPATLTAQGWTKPASDENLSQYLFTGTPSPVAAALAQIPGAPTKFDLVIGHQGEANLADSAKVYAYKVTWFNAWLSNALIDPDVTPIVLGELACVSQNGGWYAAHKAALWRLAQDYPNIRIASSKNIDTISDTNLHFSGPGIVKLGKRYAEMAFAPPVIDDFQEREPKLGVNFSMADFTTSASAYPQSRSPIALSITTLNVVNHATLGPCWKASANTGLLFYTRKIFRAPVSSAIKISYEIMVDAAGATVDHRPILYQYDANMVAIATLISLPPSSPLTTAMGKTIVTRTFGRVGVTADTALAANCEFVAIGLNIGLGGNDEECFFNILETFAH